MAFSAPSTGHGTQIAFGTTTAYGSDQTNKITNLAVNGISVSDNDTSHLGLTVGDYKTYIPGDLKEGDTLTISVLKDMDAEIVPTHVTETVTVTEPITDGTNTTNGTMAFSGYVNNSSWGYPMDGIVAGEYSVKVAGNITFTPSSA